MRPAAARLLLVGILRMIFFIDADRDAPPGALDRHRHDRMRRLGKRRVIIVRRHSLRFGEVGNIDDTETAVPAARPHLVAEAQRVVQTVTLARPGRGFAGGEVLPRHPPARNFLRLCRVLHVVSDKDIAHEAVHLGRDIGVARVHIETVHADAAGEMMMDQLGLRLVGDVVDAEAAVAVGLRLVLFDVDEVGFGQVELRQEFGARRIAAERLAQAAPDRRHILGAPTGRRRIALMVDHHNVAGDAHFVAVRREIADRNRGDQARVGRVGNVDDRGAEILLVRNVRDISGVARNGDLPRARQIEMAQAPHVARRRAVGIDFGHQIFPSRLTRVIPSSRRRPSRSRSISEFRL